MADVVDGRASPSPEPGPQGPPSPGGRRTQPARWIGIGAAIAILAGTLLVVRGHTRGGGAAATGRSPAAQEARPVPVVAAAASRRDVPIYLDGLGNVAAYKTVTVKTQVDGRLDQVLFREGQAVRRGQVLAQIDPRPFQIQLRQAEGALARDQAQLENARINVTRDRTLIAGKLIAQQQLDSDVAAAGQLEGAVEIDQAAVQAARLNLVYARVAAPLDGVTGIRQVDPGNVVHAADAGGIVVITQLDPIAVVFTLPQDQLGPVSEQLARGSMTVDAYGRDGSTLLGSGRLELIDNQINQATSTIRLKAIVPNPGHRLWPNQFVNARLHLTTRSGALVVPATALQRGPSGAFVYVIGSDMTVSPRPVQVEATQGELALIAKGLQEDERVVVDGQNQLRPGSRVAVRGPGGRPELARDGASPAPPGGESASP